MNGSSLALKYTLSAVGVWLLVAAHSGQAQVSRARGRPKAKPQPEILRVKRFSGLGNKNVIRTPEYKTDTTRGIKTPQEWYQIVVTYDTAPEWIDELTFQYFALAVRRKEGKRLYSLFKTVVRYADIQKGRSHFSTAYLHPKALERYGSLAAVAFEIVHEGKVIAEESDEDVKLPETWWKNPLVTESQEVTVHDGYLLDRSQSPFALINIDDYEFIK